jgi:hypothetical protein
MGTRFASGNMIDSDTVVPLLETVLSRSGVLGALLTVHASQTGPLVNVGSGSLCTCALY